MKSTEHRACVPPINNAGPGGLFIDTVLLVKVLAESGAGDVAQLAKHMPSVCKALSYIPSMGRGVVGGGGGVVLRTGGSSQNWNE